MHKTIFKLNITKGEYYSYISEEYNSYAWIGQKATCLGTDRIFLFRKKPWNQDKQIPIVLEKFSWAWNH